MRWIMLPDIDLFDFLPAILLGIGAIPLALALSLEGPYARTLQLIAFGVVLFTLLVQGTTMEFLLERLGLGSDD